MDGTRKRENHAFHIFRDIQGLVSILRSLICLQLFQFTDAYEGNQPVSHIFSNKAGHIYRILGGGIGRRISQLQFCQSICGAVQTHDGGNGIHSFIHAVLTDDLRA